MNTYIATFYTHAGALLMDRSLKSYGIKSRMMPVPRKLSSSCGTCVQYESEDSMIELASNDRDVDLEGLYIVENKDYRKIN